MAEVGKDTINWLEQKIGWNRKEPREPLSNSDGRPVVIPHKISDKTGVVVSCTLRVPHHDTQGGRLPCCVRRARRAMVAPWETKRYDSEGKRYHSFVERAGRLPRDGMQTRPRQRVCTRRWVPMFCWRERLASLTADCRTEDRRTEAVAERAGCRTAERIRDVRPCRRSARH